MSNILVSRQAGELNKAIIAYLSANKLPKSAAALRDELDLCDNILDATAADRYKNLLEKKWIGIVRLQKKIMDLESKIAELQSELDNGTPTSIARRIKDPSSWLPTLPPRNRLESHQNTINCIAFHPVFTSIASGSDDCTIKIWDWELGELERTIKGHTRAVLDLDYGGPKGRTLLASCSSDLTIKIWNPADNYHNVRTLSGHDHSVSAVRFIPSGAAGAPASGNLLVSASRDTTLKMWDATTGYCTKTLRGHTDWVRDICPSSDGRYVLSVGHDKTFRVWDITAWTQVAIGDGHQHYIECCAFAPPASYSYLTSLAGLTKPPPLSSTAEFIATGSRDNSIRLWDTRGTCIKTLVGHDSWVRALIFHPGGRYLLSVSDDKSLRCWDLSQEGKCAKRLTGVHDGFITCLKWAPVFVKDVPIKLGSARNGQDAELGETASIKGTKVVQPDIQIRCIMATAGVDMTVKIFAN